MAGRQGAPVTITYSVIQRNLLEKFDCILHTLYSAVDNRMEWLKWLVDYRLIHNKKDFARCQWPMKLVHRESWSSRNYDCD